MVVENCHFKSGNDYLLLSGSWLSKNKYKIDRIQSAYKNNYLVNAKPIFINYQGSIVSVDPFEIHINDGILDGVITLGKNSEGRLKMSNFDANVITQFIDSKYLDLSGIVFGELSFQNLNENSHRKLKILIENNIHNNYISYTNYINYIDIHRIVIIGFKYLGIYNYKNPEIKIYTNNFSNLEDYTVKIDKINFISLC